MAANQRASARSNDHAKARSLRSWDVRLDVAATRETLPAIVDRSIGTIGVTPDVAVGSAFEVDARLPMMPWLYDEQIQDLLLDEASRWGQGISRPCVPSSIVESLRDFATDTIGGRLRSTVHDEEAQLVPAIAPLVDWLRTLAEFAEVTPNGITVRSRSRSPMTTDPRTGLRVGLHVDSWDRLPLHLRARGRLRLCVNLGEQDRFFLFVPITVALMASRLRLPPEEVYQSYSATDIARTFLKLHPDVPVIRLRIPPGCAYIAPTENVVHDACADEETGRDISLHATLAR
jgi:hypothetical protein